MISTMDNLRHGSWTIGEAANFLGVSTKTIRRHIQAGVVEAIEVQGKHGKEWRITGIPQDSVNSSTTAVGVNLLPDLLQEKDKSIADLNRMVGAAQLRISQLENEIKLLKAPAMTVDILDKTLDKAIDKKPPWWKRLFKRG
jgi:excisionase family DNA binding protein